MKDRPAYDLRTNGVKQSLRLGMLVYTVLAVLAAVFYLERIAMLDMAFQVFHILRTGSLQIQSGRFGAAATQGFPWVAQMLQLPLKSVLLSYSLGHALYYWLVFGLITAVLGQWKWGLVFVLLSTGMVTHTFYWLSEMPQGLAFLMLVFAWIDWKGSLGALKRWEYPLLAGAMVTAFYFHPMVLYALVFCSLFLLLEKPLPAGRRNLILFALAIFFGAALVKYKLLQLDWYDAIALERAQAFELLWPQWFDLKSNRDFVRWCRSDYYLVPLLFFLNTGFYLWKGLQWKAALAALFPVCYVLLVNIPFHAGERQFYMENLYLPLAVFVSVPFIFDVLPGFFGGRYMVLTVALLAGIGLIRIYRAHTGWTQRLQWEQGFLEKTAGLANRKLLLPEQNAPADTLLLSWGSAYEFLLLSSLEHPDSARCILIDESPGRFDSLLRQRRLFLGEFRHYSFDSLPRRYFNVVDTSTYARY